MLHHPHDCTASAKADVGDAVLRSLDQKGHDVLVNELWRHDARNLRQDMERCHTIGVANARRVLIDELGQQVCDSPVGAKGVCDLLQVLDGSLAHRVHRVAKAGEENGLQLGLEHLHAKELGKLRHLLDHTLTDSPVVVHDEVLDCVKQRVNQAVDAEHLADEPGVRHDVQADVVELILHEVRDEAQQLSLGDVASERLGHGAQHLRQSRSHGLRGVQAEGLELRQDVLLQLLAGERLGQVQARLDHAHSLLPDLLLIVLHELDEGLHQTLRGDFRAKGLAQLIEVLRYSQPDSPGAVLRGILDH
mmetsp:Transcript_65917/g.118825  ORF Transcript_65917/g.118825 Transcript_65917/m.118825 type:complete len:305 (-) Transcript_65917:805-1719(-)